MRRLVGAGMRRWLACTVAGLASVAAFMTPAQADDWQTPEAFWHSCAPGAITWSMYVHPRGNGLNIDREQRLVRAALDQVARATSGRYAFRYVPGTSVAYMQARQGLQYVSDPPVDLLVAVLPDGTPTDGVASVGDFSGWGAQVNDRHYTTYYDLEGAPTILTNVAALVNFWAVVDATRTEREALYLQSMLRAVGLSTVSSGAHLSATDRRALRALAAKSCRAVETWPLLGSAPEAAPPALTEITPESTETID